MGEQIGNERENEPTINAELSALTKAVQSKLMLDRFEKPFNRPAFATQLNQVNARIGMSRSDKAQLSFVISAFEPKPREDNRYL